MVASKVFIARHGERIDHVDPTWKSTVPNPHDPFLTERGLAQARCLGRRLAEEGISKIFVSPFYRTVQTAAAVAEAGNIPMYIEPGICEGLLRAWFPRGMPEFREIDEMKAEFPHVDTSYVPAHIPTYPETKKDVFERVNVATRKLVEGENGTILLVGHGISCDSAARALLGVDSVQFIDYCALMEVVQTGESADMKFSWGATAGPDTTYIREDFRPSGRCEVKHVRETTHMPKAKAQN